MAEWSKALRSTIDRRRFASHFWQFFFSKFVEIQLKMFYLSLSRLNVFDRANIIIKLAVFIMTWHNLTIYIYINWPTPIKRNPIHTEWWMIWLSFCCCCFVDDFRGTFMWCTTGRSITTSKAIRVSSATTCSRRENQWSIFLMPLSLATNSCTHRWESCSHHSSNKSKYWRIIDVIVIESIIQYLFDRFFQFSNWLWPIDFRFLSL